jgi:hypothetical protein
VTVGEVLREAAASAGLEIAVLPEGGTTFLVGDTRVAVVSADGSTAEFRLDPAVAAAAQRTPDTSTSERGPEWVRFGPAEVDAHAIDRAVAWLGSAIRRAGGAAT